MSRNIFYFLKIQKKSLGQGETSNIFLRSQFDADESPCFQHHPIQKLFFLLFILVSNLRLQPMIILLLQILMKSQYWQQCKKSCPKIVVRTFLHSGYFSRALKCQTIISVRKMNKLKNTHFFRIILLLFCLTFVPKVATGSFSLLLFYEERCKSRD